jgi:hypothetical protein
MCVGGWHFTHMWKALKRGCRVEIIFPGKIIIGAINQDSQCDFHVILSVLNYPLANEVAKGYSNATVRPSVTSL